MAAWSYFENEQVWLLTLIMWKVKIKCKIVEWRVSELRHRLVCSELGIAFQNVLLFRTRVLYRDIKIHIEFSGCDKKSSQKISDFETTIVCHIDELSLTEN